MSFTTNGLNTFLVFQLFYPVTFLKKKSQQQSNVYTNSNCYYCLVTIFVTNITFSILVTNHYECKIKYQREVERREYFQDIDSIKGMDIPDQITWFENNGDLTIDICVELYTIFTTPIIYEHLGYYSKLYVLCDNKSYEKKFTINKYLEFSLSLFPYHNSNLTSFS